MLTTRFEELRMSEDESFDSFYSKLNEVVIGQFNLGEKTEDSKVVRKILRSLPESFLAKVTAIEESKDLDDIKVQELTGFVHASNELNGSVSLLGSQYTYNVGFGFPTLGDSNLETQQRFYNHWTAFPSLFVALDLDLRLSFQNFNNLFLSLASCIYNSKLVGKS